MEKIGNFLKRNWLATTFGLLFYMLFLYFTFSGNRMCDCESTERTAPTYHRGINHFYHK